MAPDKVDKEKLVEKKAPIQSLRQMFLVNIVQNIRNYTDDEVQRIQDFEKNNPIEWDTMVLLKFCKDFSFYTFAVEETRDVIIARGSDEKLMIRLMWPYYEFTKKYRDQVTNPKREIHVPYTNKPAKLDKK